MAAQHYGVPFQRNPFPFLSNTLRLMRSAVAGQELRVFDRYHPAVFSAVWRNAVNLGDEAAFRAVLRGAGIDADELLRSVDDQSTKDELRRATEVAVERGDWRRDPGDESPRLRPLDASVDAHTRARRAGGPSCGYYERPLARR
jgi:2-hydroxychromene-2-carboxylate isomerase